MHTLRCCLADGYRQGTSIDKKIKAVVVCTAGVSISGLLFNELEILFPEFIFLDSLSTREFYCYDLDYDVVFSTVPVKTDKKLFVTRVFLNQEEKQFLRKRVMLEVNGYLPKEININEIMDIIKQYASIKDEAGLMKRLEKYFYLDKNLTPTQRIKKHLNLHDLITEETIVLKDSAASWEDAIKIASKPLLKMEASQKIISMPCCGSHLTLYYY